jgi:hypothetical protein
MTKTHLITHSPTFSRLRAREAAASPSRGDAHELLERAQEAQAGFAALFDSFDDFDELVRECIPTIDDLLAAHEAAAASAPAKRERSAGTRDRAGRGARGRSRTPRTSSGSISPYGHSRR